MAVRQIADYQSKCSDLQISNVGNIFRSFVEYDSGNYEEYLKLIKDFRKIKIRLRSLHCYSGFYCLHRECLCRFLIF